MICSRRKVLLGSALALPAMAGFSCAKEAPDDLEQQMRAVEAPTSARSAHPPAGAADLRALSMTQLMQRLGVPGLGLAVIKDFQIHWAKGYGVADADSGRPATLDTPFQAASISKPVMAMAVLRFVQEGRLSLDDDVNQILKTWHVPRTFAQPVTPRSLLSHTSGADDGFGFPGYAPGAPLPTIAEILDGKKPSNVGPVLFKRPAYQASKYSGGGFLVMQQALTDLAGMPFEDIMRDKVLAPLAMTRSSYLQPPPRAEWSSTAYAHDSHGRRMGAPWHVYPEQAAAGLWTTPNDLARFVIEVQKAALGSSAAVLTRAFAREMISPVGVGDFAVGFRIIKQGDGWYFDHGGSNWGFEAHLRGHLRKGYGCVIMTNAQDSGVAAIQEIGARIASAYGWDSTVKPL